MENRGTRGEAVSVVEITDKNALYVNEKALKDILLVDDIKDLPVVVISIAGAYRTGKSFMLNFLLRYLRSGCKADWLGEHDVAMDGFPWSRGSQRSTEGILLWNEVFRVNTPTGQEVAVLLMDTQGCFDSKSTRTETVAFFAISTLLSSVVVYNVAKNIQEDHIDWLWLFTNYAQLAKKHGDGKPFQKLLFLVRDWNFPFDAEYGAEGGKKLLKKRLSHSETQSPEMAEVQNQFTSSFDVIDCFLMPHPGLQLIQKREFCGAPADLDEDFSQHLKVLVSALLAPGNLVLKNVNGKTITCKELIVLFQDYANVFNEGSLPAPQSLLEANAKQQLEVARRKGIEHYESNMDMICGHTMASLTERGLESAQHESGHPTDCLQEGELNKAHEEWLKSSLKVFDSTSKLNCGTLIGEYRDSMEKAIQEHFEFYSNYNRMKIAMNKMKKSAEITTETIEIKKQPKASRLAAVVGMLTSWLKPFTWSRALRSVVLCGMCFFIHKFRHPLSQFWKPSSLISNNHNEPAFSRSTP